MELSDWSNCPMCHYTHTIKHLKLFSMLPVITGGGKIILHGSFAAVLNFL